MNARDRRRGWAAVAAAAVIGSAGIAAAQNPGGGRVPIQTKAKAAAPGGDQAASSKTEAAPEAKVVRIPVNPTDAVALVNGKPITRQRLAEEALVRKGEEVLDALISRELIEQAVTAKKLTITQQEIDEEIDHVAATVGQGVTRDQWLRTLSKERKISPTQYARDIIYPGIALKKLAMGRVQVTDKDLADAFAAHFGDKLICRIIMVAQERDAIAMYNELQKNPGGFANLAQKDPRSIDDATKANAGLLGQPLTRHAYPRNVSDSAFEQLVDGDPNDKDPKHKPQNGSITGPIQVTDNTWILMKREGVIPATPQDPKDPAVRKKLHDMIFDAKLKEEMSEVFEALVRASAVENKLTGQIKLASEETNPDYRVDSDVKLMSGDGTKPAAGGTPTPAAASNAVRQKAAASAVKPEDRKAAEGFMKNAAGSSKDAAPAPK